MDLIKPHTAEKVESRQQQQKVRHDNTAKPRDFQLNDSVFVKNYGRGQRWLPGKIIKVTGPVSFLVKLANGRYQGCHQDQLRHSAVVVDPTVETPEPNSADVLIPFSSSESNQSEECTNESVIEPTSSGARVSETAGVTQRYPKRAHVPPNRLEPNWI